MQINAQLDYTAATRSLLVDAPRQVPFAVALTLTRLAKAGQAAFVKEMPAVFDRPTVFTLNAVATTAATKTNPAASVFFKQSEAASGRSKNEHIRPGSLGASARAQKKTEYLLTRLGDLPPGWVTVPGNSMPLDSFGNLAGAYYKQIVNVLQLKANTSAGAVRPVSKASQKRAARMGVASEIFCVVPGKNTLAKGGGWLPPGVYTRQPKQGLLQMLKFVRRASYEKRLDVVKIARDVVRAQLLTIWSEAVNQTIRTAIKGSK